MEKLMNDKDFEKYFDKIYKEEQMNFFIEKFKSLNESEKTFVTDLLSVLYPESKNTLNESKWWNTVGDIVGIFDPTGAVDLVNGLDYMRQGDYFFGLLSMISIIPYVGDAVAKPIMGVSKGSRLMKGVNEAMRLAKAGKTAEAAKILEKFKNRGGLISKLFESVPKWGEKLKSVIDALPLKKITGGLRNTIKDWIDLFIKVAEKRGVAKAVTGNLASKIAKSTPKEAESLLKTLKSSIKSDTRIFKNFKPQDANFMAKYFWPGLTPGILFRNRGLTSLMRRTKWYAGLLDRMGFGNWVGPEELVKQVPEKELNKEFQEYVNSPEGQQNWKDEFGGVEMKEPSVTTNSTQPSQTQTQSGDAFSGLFDAILGPVKTGLV
jgi:hypothetical protein